ncbi:MAG: hypothetical protein CMF37_15290 [Leeuwenhoekiella sp.]|nr:hypothetical protein [Leeuwenhoekiella sp.]MBH14276.1 hypothetical protein [Leeuwenhoekiella sp.]MBQ50217.1 hypothetical protein [Leeuwenhoekiella sp.]MBQ50414.1 hypothetical protein [Leeuwenhoekiella sp.]|tara:strand:+ start:2524 stop:4080 length:1557 start_codon:yes stop_codon:yes gene_type:complete
MSHDEQDPRNVDHNEQPRTRVTDHYDQHELGQAEEPEETIKPTFTQTGDYSTPLDESKNTDVPLALPSANMSNMFDVLSDMAKVSVSSDSAQLWKDTLELSLGEDIMPYSKMFAKPFFEERLASEGSDFRQYVDSDSGRLSAVKPRIGKTNPGGTISGEAALLKVNAMLTMGTSVQIPLWHSGMWVSIKAPSEGALIELDERIALEKGKLGRSTRGTAFSHSGVYIRGHLFNFIIDHIYDCNVKDWNEQMLRENILVTDYSLLIWGLSCAVFPKGYPFTRACMSDISECQHVIKETLNIPKLLWTDNSVLSEKQRTHMAQRSSKVTLERVKWYQEEFTHPNAKALRINAAVSMDLRVPTMLETISSGVRWAEDIERMTEEGLGKDIKYEKRARYMQEQSKLIMLRRYSHWVGRFVIGEGDDAAVVAGNDRETIDKLCEQLSADTDTIKTFRNHMQTFIDNAAFSIVGIPTYTCPSCGGEQKDAHGRSPYLIPLEIEQLFIILVAFKRSKRINERSEVD